MSCDRAQGGGADSSRDFTAGDSVMVREGVADPDFGTDISGWQGRVEEVYADGMLSIRWDSTTLREMGVDHIIRCENDNLDWELMTLADTDVQQTDGRDAASDVKRVVLEIWREIQDDPRLEAE